jgi:TetR/AcrR family transcriptional regulator, tetracycline repressor protein
MARQETEASGLSRDAVIQASLDLLDAVGVTGLSMRAVAERLGVKAASLYWHLRDKEQLLESVAGAVLDRVEVPVSPPGWRPQVAAACEQLTTLLTAHRAAADVVIGSLPAVQRSRLVRELGRTLAAAGVDHPEAAAFALVVAAAASASVTPKATARPRQGSLMTLAIDSGSWRVQVRAAAAGSVAAATSVGGGGAPSVDVRPGGLVLVRNRRGGNGGGVELSPEYTWYIKVHGGTWNTALDLSGLRISGIELDSGAANVSCTLPAPAGIVPIRVNSGLVGVTLRRPRDAAVHATVSSGSVKVRFDERPIRAVTSDVHWDTPGALGSDDRYDLTVHSGCVRVTMDASAPDVSAPQGRSAPPVSGFDQGVGLILDGIEKRLAGG